MQKEFKEKKYFLKKCCWNNINLDTKSINKQNPDLNIKTNANIYTKIDLTLKHETIKFLEGNNKMHLWSGIRQRVLKYDT